ncbi:MAG: CooT family nickel-binding protein [Candidatus Lokiarchaeota archaeon]|nr:CooT family nickel-binding protein [Candidatus Lokiarchaeota archaeon]
MCLSKVYLKNESGTELLSEEVVQVICDSGAIVISTFFGEDKRVDGLIIEEVNLMDGTIFLRRARQDIVL